MSMGIKGANIISRDQLDSIRSKVSWLRLCSFYVCIRFDQLGKQSGNISVHRWWTRVTSTTQSGYG
jgi:hypothetical protein